MFEISLEINRDALAAASPQQTDEEFPLEDLTTQIVAACSAISRAKVAKFRLACCGNQVWPVDIWVDFAIFLEQSLDVLLAIKDGLDVFRFEFFEQGTESVVIFSATSSGLRVSCESFWGGECIFGNQEEFIEPKHLVSAIKKSVQGFIECCEKLCPDILNLPEIMSWHREIEQHTRLLLGQ
jgi:hypothetical protein